MFASHIADREPSSGTRKVATECDVTLVYGDPTLRIITSRNVLFTLWSDAPTVPQLGHILTAAKDLRTSWPKGVAQAQLVLKGTPRFSDAVRADSVALLKKKAEYVNLALAYVVLAHGLAGTAARAFLSTLVLLSRTQTPTRVFAELPTASQWLALQFAASDVAWSPADLERVCRQVIAG